MKDHYGFTGEEYDSLLKSGVTFAELFKDNKKYLVEERRLDDPIPISTICLYYYIDKTRTDPLQDNTSSGKIFTKLFSKLTTEDKLAVSDYIELAENNYRD